MIATEVIRGSSYSDSLSSARFKRWLAYRPALRSVREALNRSKKIYVLGDIHTDTIESAFFLLKRGMDMLAGHQQEIQAERDRKLEAAR
jgi:hypothetical protein